MLIHEIKNEQNNSKTYVLEPFPSYGQALNSIALIESDFIPTNLMAPEVMTGLDEVTWIIGEPGQTHTQFDYTFCFDDNNQFLGLQIDGTRYNGEQIIGATQFTSMPSGTTKVINKSLTVSKSQTASAGTAVIVTNCMAYNSSGTLGIIGLFIDSDNNWRVFLPLTDITVYSSIPTQTRAILLNPENEGFYSDTLSALRDIEPTQGEILNVEKADARYVRL